MHGMFETLLEYRIASKAGANSYETDGWFVDYSLHIYHNNMIGMIGVTALSALITTGLFLSII